MANEALARLIVSLETQTAKYQRGLDNANRKLDRFTKHQEKQAGRVSKAFRGMGKIIAGAISIQAVRTTVKMADQYNQLSTRIKTATRETGDFEQVQRQLAAISVEVGTSFESTISTFQALSRVRADLGATNAQFVTLTRTVNQLGVIGGASTTAIANGLRQFNQGLAAGVFRAEEFNSIVENMPELSNALARSMNLTQGELRQMVIDGKLLSKDVFQNLLRIAPEIAEQFKEIPNNLDRAFNALTTSLGQAFSALDKGLGGTQKLADVLSAIAKELQIVSGTAEPLELLQRQLQDLVGEIAVAENAMRLNREGTEAYERAAAQLVVLRARYAGTTEAAIYFAERQDEAAAAAEDAADRAATAWKTVPLTHQRGGQVRGPFQTRSPEESRNIPLQGPPAPEPAFDANLQALVMTTRDSAAEMDEMIFGVFDIAADRQKNFNSLFVDNMVQAANGGFKGILDSWVRTLQQMAAKALASQIFKLLGFGNESGGVLGIGKLFGGERAAGGPVSGGKSYLVGERGPELFTPSGSGNIIPNGAGGGVTINQNLRVTGSSRAEFIAAAEALREQTKGDVIDYLERR